MHAPPVAIAFRNAEDGLLAAGHTIQATSDGGRTWHVVFRTPRSVMDLSYDPNTGRPRAVLDDGENLGGPRWQPEGPLKELFPPCQPFDNAADFSDDWVLCIGQSSAGEGFKTAYHLVQSRWRRCGSLTRFGYAYGIAMAHDGFGIVWEGRGTLYVTRDGCAHWTGLPTVAAPDLDFGISGSAVRGGRAWVILARGDVDRRLLATTDHGRTWRLVHRWG
jgi:hypothetical protein